MNSGQMSNSEAVYPVRFGGRCANADYEDFLRRKTRIPDSFGPQVDASAVNSLLFLFQRDLVIWAVRRRCAAIFADTGLGKTLMQLEWLRLVTDGKPGLIIAPLGVTSQTIAEARKLGLEVTYSRDGAVHPFTITNYELSARFEPKAFRAVVLDESSILKAYDGKTRSKLIREFGSIPYRLCCTATPAPNDTSELGNHAEFLGMMTRSEMLASFYVHDEQRWRLKGHAEDAFYRWLAGWSMSLRRPSDLGYDDDGFNLPPLSVEPIYVQTKHQIPGSLFVTRLRGIGERLSVRRGTLMERCTATVAVTSELGGQWVIWHNLNAEGRALHSMIPDSVLVQGTDELDEKTEKLTAFVNGSAPILISKPRICGFGMNFQHCYQIAFVGLSDSWEQYYQAIRRCYRYRQTRPVKVLIVLSELESAIYENVMRKEAEAMIRIGKTMEHVKDEEARVLRSKPLMRMVLMADESGDGWHMRHGDAVLHLREIGGDSVGLSVFSPPFMSLYTYTASPADLGNSDTPEQFWEHFGYIISELLRITEPGRNCCVHVAQVPALLVRDGYIGLKDFRGETIRRFEQRGWIYHGEVCIDKDPQAQAIRTKSKGLLFIQMRKDASWLRPALADYILVFRKPGENKNPIVPDISNDQWIEWARPVWYGIRESDTLNAAEARDEKDERHICPLQLGTIERCIRLWSNPGDLTLSPFAGIGSEGYVAIQQGRRFEGVELKESYFRAAVKNLRAAERAREQQPSLWGMGGTLDDQEG